MVYKDSFPVPVIDEVMQKLYKAKVFTVMDLENGFFHVPIEETSKKLTAFVTKQGLYEFYRAPFGFCNSPAYFVRFVCCIFQDLINRNIMELYIDDVVVFGETEEECLSNLKIVLQTAEKFGLRFKWSKCSFMKTEIDFLGHTVENRKI